MSGPASPSPVVGTPLRTATRADARRRRATAAGGIVAVFTSDVVIGIAGAYAIAARLARMDPGPKDPPEPAPRPVTNGRGAGA